MTSSVDFQYYKLNRLVRSPDRNRISYLLGK
ncbi:hypothetical protein JL09_g6922 [Pichia kudriavzevii]|uniref:Uncharacterized protein n=1 Tax=Pichia kudriavzevii TaxID=4909 RepID=A0A099NKL1_PICKU|nr:hypothetical protein JL09_g6922 [Pichia kudriavzevii]